MTMTFDGQLEIDERRGVIYFHSAQTGLTITLYGKVERGDIEYLVSIAGALVTLLDELEDEGGYHDSRVKDRAFEGVALDQPDEDGWTPHENTAYYNAIRRAIEITGWTKRTWEERHGADRTDEAGSSS